VWRGRRGWRGRGKRWAPWASIPVIEQLYDLLALAQSEPRHSIIEALLEGEKSTNELYQYLESKGYSLPRTTLYYHLSELESAGIIEHAGYKETGGGAPEKVWKLRTRVICIDIPTGLIKFGNE
jgi:DNA-binding transcriptional ArsR family regulator